MQTASGNTGRYIVIRLGKIGNLDDEYHVMLECSNLRSKFWNTGKITFHTIIYKDPASMYTNYVNLSALVASAVLLETISFFFKQVLILSLFR